MDAIQRTVQMKPVMEIRTKPAEMHITNSRPRMRIKTQRPQMQISRKMPRFKFVQQKAPRQMQKGVHAKRAYTPFIEQVRRKVTRALGAIAQFDGILPFVEENVSLRQWLTGEVETQTPLKDSLEQSLSDAKKMEWEDGTLTIEWTDFVLEIEWEDVNGPTIEVEPHVVEVRIRNQPVVRVKMKPSAKTDVGSTIDEHA